MGKRQWAANTSIATDYYQGKLYYYINQSILQKRIDERIWNGPFDNTMANAMDIIASVVLAYEMMPEGIPLTNSPSDLRSARAQTALFRDHDVRNMATVGRMMRVIRLLCEGIVFTYTGWDSKQLATSVFPPDMAARAINGEFGYKPVAVSPQADGNVRVTYPFGGTIEYDIPAGLVFPEMGTQCWSAVKQYAVLEYMPVTQARERFPNHAPIFHGQMVMDSRSSGLTPVNTVVPWTQQDSFTGNRFSPMSDVCCIAHKYEKNDLGTWDHRICGGDQFQYILAEELGLVVNPLTINTLRYGDQLFLNAKSLGQDLWMLQYTHNSYLIMGLEYFTNALKDLVLLPQGSRNTMLTNDFSQVVYYDPTNGGVPVVKSMDPGTLNIITALEDRYARKIWEQAGVTDAMRGIAGERASGASIQSLVAVGSTPVEQIRRNLAECETVKYNKIGVIAQEKYTMPRLVGLSGALNEREAFQFSREDLMAGIRCKVKMTRQNPETIAERGEIAKAFLQYGVFSPGAEVVVDRVNYFMQTGEMKALKGEDTALAEGKAEHEFVAMTMGDVIPGPPSGPIVIESQTGAAVSPGPTLVYRTTLRPLHTPLDQNEIELQVHMRQYFDPSTPDAIKPMLEYHIGEHQRSIQEALQTAQSLQNQQRMQESMADAAGTTLTTLASAHAAAEGKKAEVKSSPAGGGKESGRTRSTA